MDGRVHREVLSAFIRRGYPPSLDELARALAIAPEDGAAALRRLHDGHGLVLHPDSTDVWIAHPFSASPAAVWVADGAARLVGAVPVVCVGIVALAAPTSTIHARYAGERVGGGLEVREGAASDDLVVHFALAPRDAWRNVVHWCSTVLPFRRAEDVAPWCERHGLPRGAVLSWAQVIALGRAWYGRHLEEDWRKHTVAEAQAIFDGLGLRGDFWQLPISDRPF